MTTTDATIYTYKYLDIFTAFVIERYKIYVRRFVKGQSAPWTKDKILTQYRFCNVFREDDRVTKWIAVQWRHPHRKDPDLWFAMLVARLINHPDTLNLLALPGRWNKKQFISALEKRKASGEKVYGSAYIVSTNGIAQDKVLYLADEVLDPMWEAREKIRPRKDERIQDFFNRLMAFNGMGTFMAAQIVADIKYVAPLVDAKDWYTFAASGPGSRRGMSYLMGHDPRTPWKEHEWKDALMELSTIVRPTFADAGLPRMHNQDLQNCLCEFSKYRRTMLGTGRPKQKFVPFGE